jgi:hypothetical protein
MSVALEGTPSRALSRLRDPAGGAEMMVTNFAIPGYPNVNA